VLLPLADVELLGLSMNGASEIGVVFDIRRL